MTRERKTDQIGLRIQPSFRTLLERWAAVEHRSVTSLVEKVMIDAAKAAGYEVPEEKPGKRTPKKQASASAEIAAV